MTSHHWKQRLAGPRHWFWDTDARAENVRRPTGRIVSEPGEGEEQEPLWPGLFNRQGCKMSARPKSQMHHRALSSPYSNAPPVTIFNLIKTERHGPASREHARLLQ